MPIKTAPVACTPTPIPYKQCTYFKTLLFNETAEKEAYTCTYHRVVQHPEDVGGVRPHDLVGIGDGGQDGPGDQAEAHEHEGDQHQVLGVKAAGQEALPVELDAGKRVLAQLAAPHGDLPLALAHKMY